MTRARGDGGLEDRIRNFLRARGAPAASALLVERFLRAAAGSEEAATRLLTPTLEPAGMIYWPGEGWVAPRERADPAPRLVAALAHPETGQVHLAEETGLEGATLVLREPRAEVALLRSWLRARGLPQPAAFTSLRAVLRGSARLPRGAQLADICATLGIRWLEGDEPAGIVAAMTACLRAAAAVAPIAPPLPEEASLPGRIRAEEIAALPEGPGTYAFFDAGGVRLYVGKALNLKHRVSSYFKPGSSARRGGHGSRFLNRIDRLEVRPAGSELEALLREASLIQRHAPDGNVQRAVHERGRRYGEGRSWALLLPSGDRRRVTAVVVRGGRYLGAAAVGQRDGASRKLRALVGRAVCPAGRRAPAPTEAIDHRTEILSSWLARHGDTVSRLELDAFTKASAAITALRAAARALLSGEARTLFR
jgi:hypothetical protein